MKKVIFVFFLVLLTFPFHGFCDYIENITENAYVDWTNGVIKAKGVGYPSQYSEGTIAQKKLEARQAAKTEALRKLAEAVNRIRIDGKTLVRDFQVKDEAVRSRIQAFVKNCAEKEVTYFPDGKCEVVVEASLTGEGSLSHIIYDNLKVTDLSGKTDKEEAADEAVSVEVDKKSESEKGEAEISEVRQAEDISPQKEAISQAPVTEEKISEMEQAVKAEEQQEEPAKKPLPSFVSGLIVNATKTQAKPAINPAIISDTGERLYDISVPDKMFRIRQGLASYTAKVENAETNKRVTKTPYVIEALKVVQDNPCIIMVSKKEFDEFRKLRGSDIVLERAKVIIVVGK